MAGEVARVVTLENASTVLTAQVATLENASTELAAQATDLATQVATKGPSWGYPDLVFGAVTSSVTDTFYPMISSGTEDLLE